jgi:hypothetical protein
MLCLSCLTWQSAQSAELTGRFSMLGTTANAKQGDAGYLNKDNVLSADQQSLRVMLDSTKAPDEANDNNEWSVQLKLARRHVSDIIFNDNHSSVLFRYDKLAANWLDEKETTSATRIGYEVDRAVYKQRFKNSTFALGRQPIDWGSGRFWQPLNVFGSFSPTDLDTDYKPGIDAARLDWFPSGFSSLTAVYTFSDNKIAAVNEHKSAALHYRSQVGEQSEYALVAGGIIGNRVLGASFESSWAGMGWRVEGLHTQFTTTEKDSILWIAGIDYQFSNGTLLTAEWYDNSRGANSVSSLGSLATGNLLKYGLQQHRSKNVLGIALSKTISPLLQGSYSLLASPLKDVDGQYDTSLLHQFNFTYSVSDESDLLFSFLFASGKGLNNLSKAQSEFGHIPTSMTLRLRFYF